MPARYYDELLSLRDSASDLLSPTVFRPHYTRSERYYPYDHRQRHPKSDDGVPKVRKTLEELTTPGLEDRRGDLGWSLDYATAYCWKHLCGSKPSIVATIDLARRAPPKMKAPFLIFDSLDRCLFQGKLHGMVYLKWRSLSDNSPGVTSACGVKDSRVCIELNDLPFRDEESGADLDDLLDALIHQMIHAYFLVCCGTQPQDKHNKREEQDGRLLDGLHFGVIMATIKQISDRCEDGPLPLKFYACQRSGRHDVRALIVRRALRRANYDDKELRPGGRSFIAIDAKGDTVGSPDDDGQSHCIHDNRRFRGADIHNWQVKHYAMAIDQKMEQRGYTIYDLDISGDLVPVERLRGPPSSTYVELIWDDKRIMVPREKVMEFDSLRKEARREGWELGMPKFDFETVKCIWDFIQHRVYSPQYQYDYRSRHRHHPQDTKGPPIIVHGRSFALQAASDGIAVHIRVFKAAHEMKFKELGKYALERLYDMPSTSDDPIVALREIYNAGDEDHLKDKAVHSDLHKWAREFLARTDEPRHLHLRDRQRHYRDRWDHDREAWDPSYARGTSNYEKLLYIHGDRFQELYYRCPALKDDSKLVVAQISCPGLLTDETSLPAPIGADSSSYSPSPLLARRRSFSDYHDPLPLRYGSPAPSSALLERPGWHCDSRWGVEGAPVTLRRPYYDYFSRSSGRRRRVDALTGKRYTLSRERWRDLYALV